MQFGHSVRTYNVILAGPVATGKEIEKKDVDEMIYMSATVARGHDLAYIYIYMVELTGKEGSCRERKVFKGPYDKESVKEGDM